MFSKNLHSMKMTWEENTWGRNYRVRKFWYESSVFEIPGEKYTVNRGLRPTLCLQIGLGIAGLRGQYQYLEVADKVNTSIPIPAIAGV